MFLKLLPDQVMRYWDQVRLSIESALPPHVEGNFLRLQELFLIGDMDCWVSYTNNTIRTVVTTQVIRDTATDTMQLLIFSLTSVEDMYSETWKEMYEALPRYARSRGCRRIIAYTCDERLVDLARRFGADCTWYLISLEV